MAVYKQPCMHCRALIDRDARICPSCASRSPFGYICPSCRSLISKNDVVCASCGRSLRVLCPVCKTFTFAADKCENCESSLLIQCKNPRCGVFEFFENEKCTACGKRVRKRR